MQYINTINTILNNLSNKGLFNVHIGTLLETYKTIYKNDNEPVTNIVVEGDIMSQPIAASKSMKSLMKKDNSLLSLIYKDIKIGDILLVEEVKDNVVVCENMSLKKEYRKKIVIDKMDILMKNFVVLERISVNKKKILDNLLNVKLNLNGD